MKHIEEQLARFIHLSPDEQRAVEAFVNEHPEWEARLEEVRTLDPLLEHVYTLQGDPPDEETLAYYLYAQQTTNQQPPLTKDLFDQLTEQIDQDPTLKAQTEAVSLRLQELEAASDAAAQFERLTGHKLQENPTRAVDRQPQAHRHARIYRLNQRVMRWGVAAVLAFGGLYGGLFLASHLSQSEAGRLASLTSDDAHILIPETLRSGTLPDSTLQTSPAPLYNEGVDFFDAARATQFLGFFPTYDAALLDSALAHFNAVLQVAESNSYEALEAHFMLGRIHLLNDDTASAKASLQRVVDGGGNKIREAERMLARLE